MLDPRGGQCDLRARTIRVLHAGSFQDDPTRIFRAIRFEQRFGFHLARSTSRLLGKAASTNLIRQLSGPRLQNEILLLFAEHDPVRAIARLDTSNYFASSTDVCVTRGRDNKQSLRFPRRLPGGRIDFQILRSTGRSSISWRC